MAPSSARVLLDETLEASNAEWKYKPLSIDKRSVLLIELYVVDDGKVTVHVVDASIFKDFVMDPNRGFKSYVTFEDVRCDQKSCVLEPGQYVVLYKQASIQWLREKKSKVRTKIIAQ